MAGDGQRRERKVVSVLFCDLVGFTSRAESLDPEDVEAILRPYHARVRSELERHGGTVEKFIGDAVMALFGAPVAHEDDPERAVRAALAIRDFALEDGLELRIGVTTGEALVSLDADPGAGEGMASGDVVNTAARLQNAASVNGVLVDETTYRAVRHVVDFEDAAAVDAKGKAEPVRRNAWAYLQIGRTDDARNLFAEAIPLYEKEPYARPWTFPEVAFDLGETTAARGIVERLAPSVRRRAMLAVLDGNFEESTGAYGQAGVRLLEAESRLRWAEQLVAAGRRDAGSIELEKALSFYRSVGATVFIQRGEQLLAKTA